ncbi:MULTISPECIES: acyl carrier protein [Streptomyces]|uniref:Polyketide-8 synthase acyl carrier protein n=1 Tax=Streptomyces alboflavus TaxID=67267 RepID=A0A1Z1WDY5_9ACTN|nr:MULTISPECIES: phosphopantetheine-binding protein [Streptomyces]ARX84619.1 polyketide-8 synthase acyl carrier protein [Streptomyces alboflavus]WJV47754.1 phosphopantetheine-binding protein [Streptomyces flavofungini]
MSDIVISEEQRERVRAVVADVLEADLDALTDRSSFADDFEADSLLVIEIFSRFERDLGIKIPQEAMTELDDLPSAYALVAAHSAPEALGV